MRTIRPTPKAPKDQLAVSKPGTAPPRVPTKTPSLIPQGAADGRSYGKQPPQIAPPTGLPGQGVI